MKPHAPYRAASTRVHNRHSRPPSPDYCTNKTARLRDPIAPPSQPIDGVWGDLCLRATVKEPILLQQGAGHIPKLIAPQLRFSTTSFDARAPILARKIELNLD